MRTRDAALRTIVFSSPRLRCPANVRTSSRQWTMRSGRVTCDRPVPTSSAISGSTRSGARRGDRQNCTRGSSTLDQREFVGELGGGAPAPRDGVGVGEELEQRLFQRVDVFGGDGVTDAALLDDVGERVAARGHHRQPGPEVVEDAGAERELGLDVVEVRADAEIGLEQVVLPVVVRRPTPR